MNPFLNKVSLIIFALATELHVLHSIFSLLVKIESELSDNLFPIVILELVVAVANTDSYRFDSLKMIPE